MLKKFSVEKKSGLLKNINLILTVHLDIIKKLNYIAIIPARKGSKEILNKNIKIIGGKPLIAWTIEQALRSKKISRVVVSTDSTEIAKIL